MPRWILRISIVAFGIGFGGVGTPCVPANGEQPQSADTAAVVPATRPATQPSFLRFVADGDGGVLQTGIVDYRNAAGQVVHLVGAVHIGERLYYQQLQKTFAGYDTLLFEMVKPDGAAILKPGDGRHGGGWIGGLQRGMQDLLDLDYQLDVIDYTAKNFVHADLTWEKFNALREERGESWLSMAIGAAMHDIQRQRDVKQPSSDVMGFAMLHAMMSDDRAREMRLIMGRQIENIEDQMSGIDGPNGSVIITERNKVALAALQKQLDVGKRNIGIFYGAGHMVDMQARLLKMGFTPIACEWRTAWTIARSKPDAGASTAPAAGGAAGPSTQRSQ